MRVCVRGDAAGKVATTGQVERRLPRPGEGQVAGTDVDRVPRRRSRPLAELSPEGTLIVPSLSIVPVVLNVPSTVNVAAEPTVTAPSLVNVPVSVTELSATSPSAPLP